MNQSTRHAALVFALSAFAGCAALEDDLNSSSNSSGSDSGSRSLGSGGGVHASASYQSDVYTYAVAAVGRDDAAGDLLRGVGRIAELHGISNWEAEPATVTALHAVVVEGHLDDGRIARLRAELAPLGPTVLTLTFEVDEDDAGTDRGAR